MAFIPWCLLWGSAAVLCAQPNELIFSNLSSLEDGFSDIVIQALARDKVGFLWAGTFRGLDRYDGVHVRRHSVRKGQLRSDAITGILEDPKIPGFLWIGTRKGGLSYYDPTNDSLAIFQHPLIDSLTITSMVIDSHDILWIGSAEAGLFRVNRLADGVVHVPLPTEPPSSRPIADSILTVHEASSAGRELWVSSNRGLFKYTSTGFKWIKSHHSFATDQVTAIVDVAGSIWLGTRNGNLFRLDQTRSNFESVQFSEVFPGKITTIEPSQVFPNVLWIGTRARGLIAYNIYTRQSTTFLSQAGDPASLSQDDVISIIEDYQDILWVGTAMGGINKALLKPPVFARDDSNLPSFFSVATAAPVLTLYQSVVEPDIIWLGSSQANLHRFNRRTQRLESMPTPPEIKNMAILDMYEDTRGNFWVGGNSGLLYNLNRRTGSHRKANLGMIAPDAQVRHIYESASRPGYLWLATRRMGVIVYDAYADSVYRQFTSSGASGRTLGANDVWQIAEDVHRPNVFWIATQGGGLNRIDLKTGTIQIWTSTDSPDCLLDNDILSLNVETDSLIWLGIARHGLVTFNPQTGQCSQFTETDGLLHQDIGSILKDDRGRIWAITQIGPSVIDPIERTVTNFTQADGLQSGEVYYHAYHKSQSGEFLLGGDKGFNVFDPNAIDIDFLPAPIAITGITIDGVPHNIEQDTEGYKFITLNPDERDLEFDFASLDLRQPSLNRYRIKLEGTDDKWVMLGTKSSERYRAVAYGWNTLYVNGTNRYGIWSQPDHPLKIYISPPYYQTWWFWSIMTALIAGLIVSAYQYRIYQLRRVESTRQTIARDLHDDMGSRLSSIALQIEMAGLQLDPLDQTRARISELAALERSLVKDLRTIVWLINAEFDSLPKLVERMQQVAEQMLQGLRYTFEKPEAIPDIPLDMNRRKNLFLLFKEALHNTLRHSEASCVNIEMAIENQILSLSIEDDGKGFDSSTITRGHGLLSMEERARSISASLDIASVPEKGTRITLWVPLRKKENRFRVITGWRSN